MPKRASLSGFLAAATLAVFTLIFAPAARADNAGLTVSDAWVRMAPATMKTHAAYMSVTNSGTEAKQLIAASSENYAEVQLHLSSVTDGIATMQRMESIEIPAGKTVKFKPGGLHLMLMSGNAPLEEGKSVPITLSFRSGETVDIEAMVMTSAPDGTEAQGMDHSAHEGHHSH